MRVGVLNLCTLYLYSPLVVHYVQRKSKESVCSISLCLMLQLINSFISINYFFESLETRIERAGAGVSNLPKPSSFANAALAIGISQLIVM